MKKTDSGTISLFLFVAILSVFFAGFFIPIYFTELSNPGAIFSGIIIFILCCVFLGYIFISRPAISGKLDDQTLFRSLGQREILVRNVNDVIWIMDLNRRITYVSPSVYELLGYNADEAKSGILFSSLTPESQEKIQKLIDRELALALDGQLSLFRSSAQELEYLKIDNSIVWADLKTAFLYDERNRCIGILGILRDISERKIAENYLRESEARYRALFEGSSNAIFNVSPDGKITMMNQSGLELFEYSLEEMTGMKAMKLFASDLDWRKFIRESIKNGRISNFEVKLRRKNGRTVDCLLTSSPRFNSDGQVMEYQGIIHDISDMKYAEGLLASEKEKLDITLDAISEGVISIDNYGKIAYMNKAAEIYTGWLSDTAVGENINEIFNCVDSKSRHISPDFIQRVIGYGEIVSREEDLTLISRDGRERTISQSIAPIRSGDSRIVGAVLIFKDLSESRRLLEFAGRAHRLETAGKIAGQVAHDFNNLLAPIMAYPHFIRDLFPENGLVQKYAGAIEKSAERMADINQQLLALARGGHNMPEPLDLNNIVIQVINQFDDFPSTLAVETVLDKGLAPVKCASSQIQRALTNLVSNAREAMEDIGRLTIKTENYYVDQLSPERARVPKGKYIKLSVTDTGIGIPPENIARIYDPFFSTKTAEQIRGSGLGLSVVHSVIEEHHGYIDCQSVQGKGTSFHLYFPVVRVKAEKAEISEIQGAGQRVLVVDDDPIQRDVILELLRELGYAAAAVSSGEEAIDFIRGNPLDLLILDIFMPHGIDGTETFRRAREINPGQKAIMISGFARSTRIDEALNLGAGALVQKPLRITQLAMAVRDELGK